MTSLGIAIPAYNNPKLLKACLESLRNQVNKNFSVHILDDASSISLRDVVQEYQDLKISYTKNTKNKGALENMAYSYKNMAANNDFVMVMHEDDQLSPTFTNYFWEIKNTYKEPAFIISAFCEFPQNENQYFFDLKKNTENKFRVSDAKQICLRFLQKNNLAFGSVIYNTRIVTEMNFDFESYGEFADRPFLLKILTTTGAKSIIIDEPVYGLRSHEESDTRWKKLRSSHVMNLMKFYKDILVQSGYISTAFFKKLSTGFIIESYKNLRLSSQTPAFFKYLISSYRAGLLSVKYAILKNSFINKTASKITVAFK